MRAPLLAMVALPLSAGLRAPPARMSVEMEGPLSPPARVARALTFWSRVVPILATYKLAELSLSAGTAAPLAALGFVGEEEARRAEAGEHEALYEAIHEWGAVRLEETIQELRGFYVKTGQVISTRVDLFPEQYTSRLASLQDSLDPMPVEVVKEVVKRELLQGEDIETIFSSFDTEPLGSASIAQVHRATLLDGRQVAVKVQRPNCEAKLNGDIANLKSFSQKLASALPIDYYTVFCELERALQGELDFLLEAQSALKVFSSISHNADGTPAAPSVTVPLPISGLVSRRVLVMDFIEGTPLNRLSAEMEKRGIVPGSPESKLAGRRILSQLTEAFGRMILGAGFIHGDPHPGNIFVQEGGKVALIDCGQVKQLPVSTRLRLAEALLLVDEWQRTGGSPELVATAQEAMSSFGVTFLPDAPPEAAAALALLLFGDPEAPMPGNFSSVELSANSPIKCIASFPQELVLMGRATILIKGIAKRLGINWPLAQKWKGMAEAALACGTDGCAMPTWMAVPQPDVLAEATPGRARFREVASSFKGSVKLLGKWAKSKASSAVPPTVKKAAIKSFAKLTQG